MTQSFALAPMSPLLRWMTIGLFLIPILFVALPLVTQAPGGLAALGLAIAALYAWVWLRWRPTRFDVSPEGVRIVFPWRSRLLPREDLSGCRSLSKKAFREAFGRGMRIGVGGLWGGFGRLWTSKRGLLDFYISRTDDFVLCERRSARPVLITPDRPESMVEAVRRLLELGAP